MPYIEIQGKRIFYDRKGIGNSPLVFVHGLTCAHKDWHNQVDHFSINRYVITPDLRGHGLSDPDTGNCEIRVFASDIAAILKELKLQPAVLVGHSMGCRVILQAQMESPESVAGLVLVDGSRAVDKSDPETARKIIGKRIADTGYSRFIREFFEDMFFDSCDSSLKEPIMKRALEFPEEKGIRLFETTVAWDAAIVEEALSAASSPILVVQSTYVTPERKRVTLNQGDSTPWIDLVRKHVPKAQVRIISNTGHFTMLEAPEKVNIYISEFIKGISLHV